MIEEILTAFIQRLQTLKADGLTVSETPIPESVPSGSVQAYVFLAGVADEPQNRVSLQTNQQTLTIGLILAIPAIPPYNKTYQWIDRVNQAIQGFHPCGKHSGISCFYRAGVMAIATKRTPQGSGDRRWLYSINYQIRVIEDVPASEP